MNGKAWLPTPEEKVKILDWRVKALKESPHMLDYDGLLTRPCIKINKEGPRLKTEFRSHDAL